MLDAQLAGALERRRAAGTRRALRLGDPSEAARLSCLVDFSSNDYLSLARSPALRAALVARLQRDATALGSTGSRLLDGDSIAHTKLEHRLAAYFRAPSALLFNSGWDANVSLLTTLPQPGDLVVYDALVHASVHDGMRASRAASCISFEHNDPSDLDAVLAGALADSVVRNVFLVLESVYSMDGTLCALQPLADVLSRHVPRAEARHILVDEAHAAGVYGAGGRGLCDALGCAHVPSARLITFGKALGCAGAVVLCPPLWRDYLLNYARPLIFSTALSPTAVATIDIVLDALEAGEADRLAHVLHERTAQLYARLGIGPAATSGALPPAPIVPVRSAAPRELAARLQQAGFLVRPVTYPTVPRGEERVRVCIHAHNTAKEVDALAMALSPPSRL